jgi:3-deoxy-D-manno-octulosonate 8-phosphate phosphatase (KDO 8-P phosphatase)
MNVSKIKLLALDVDGTLTNGTVYLSEHGDEMKGFNVKDGLGIKSLMQQGIMVAIITGRTYAIVKKRAGELGITEVHQGVDDKDRVVRSLAEKYQLSMDQIAYMGDDLNDLPAVRIVGTSFAPSDCAAELMPYIDIIVPHKGGEGAVRDAVTMILKQTSEPEECAKYMSDNI